MVSMKVSDLVKKKNATVSVRVPVSLQKSAGLKESVTGKITGIRTEGRVARVQVTVRGGKTYEFRPQDLTL
jgi:hypothetical protein